jgi:hypothetical protein
MSALLLIALAADPVLPPSVELPEPTAEAVCARPLPPGVLIGTSALGTTAFVLSGVLGVIATTARNQLVGSVTGTISSLTQAQAFDLERRASTQVTLSGVAAGVGAAATIAFLALIRFTHWFD